MKGKILSVLFCLMLAFGMIFAACDDGDIVKNPSTDSNTVLDYTPGAGSGDFKP